MFPPSSRPRLLIVSATYVARENRKKLAALRAHFEVTAVTCRRSRSSLALEERGDDEVDTDFGGVRPYRLILLSAVGRPASTTKYLLAGLGRFLRREPAFDVVLVEAEPWALVRWQTWCWVKCWQRRARFGEFSWENAERTGWRGRVLAAIYRAAIAGDDFVIAGNADAGAIFRRRGLAERRLLVAPQLGVDTDLFRPADPDPASRAARRRALNLPEDAFLVGYAGRFTAVKGVPDLQRAVATLREEAGTAAGGANGRPMHLALLGAGEMEDELRTAARTCPWLHLLPPCPHAEVAEFLRALDVFVLPSRGRNTGPDVWREQFGHVLIEAMACGVPTLGSVHGAIPEVLGHDPEACFPAGDAAALAARLRDWRRDPARVAALVVRQGERVQRHYAHAPLATLWAAHLRGPASAVTSHPPITPDP